MRKFFLALSIFILVVLISVGIHQRVTDSSIDNINVQEVGIIYSSFK